MHMLIRYILLFLKRNKRPKVGPSETTYITMTVLPVDLDFLWHVNNGMYFSYMDFGRMDLIYRNGMFDMCRKMGWYSVVAGETIKFRKSLKLWDKFTIVTKPIGYDDRNFFVSQKFVKKDIVYAEALVKIRVLKKSGGGVNPAELAKLLGQEIDNTSAERLAKEWWDIEEQYFTDKTYELPKL
jgi:acyl-CoA thioesterase FadM